MHLHIMLAELHADVFSRHASPSEVCVFVAVDEKGEDVKSDEICRRCNEKQQRRRRGGRSVQLPDWVMNKIKRQPVTALTWVTKMKSLSQGEYLHVVQPTPPTTQHFSVKRCASAQNRRKVGGWVQVGGCGLPRENKNTPE